jgi:hypothetical protein
MKEGPAEPQLRYSFTNNYSSNPSRWAKQYGDVVHYRFIFNSDSVLVSGLNELKQV